MGHRLESLSVGDTGALSFAFMSQKDIALLAEQQVLDLQGKDDYPRTAPHPQARCTPGPQQCAAGQTGVH